MKAIRTFIICLIALSIGWLGWSLFCLISKQIIIKSIINIILSITLLSSLISIFESTKNEAAKFTYFLLPIAAIGVGVFLYFDSKSIPEIWRIYASILLFVTSSALLVILRGNSLFSLALFLNLIVLVVMLLFDISNELLLYAALGLTSVLTLWSVLLLLKKTTD